MPGDIAGLDDSLASDLGPHRDVHGPLAGEPALERGPHFALDLRLHRAGGRGQVDHQRDRPGADLDVLDHAQVDQVTSEVRVLDPFQGVEHIPFSERRIGLAEHFSSYPL